LGIERIQRVEVGVQLAEALEFEGWEDLSVVLRFEGILVEEREAVVG